MEILTVALSSLLSIAVLFVIAKILGHKQLSQLDFFDYIVGITIGSIAAELATEIEVPWKGVVAMLVYGSVSVMLNFLAHRFPKTRKYINGTPTVIMDNGKIYRKNLKKANLDLTEFLLMCREAGYFDLSEIKTAIFEQTGRLSILPISRNRPLTPNDLGIYTKTDSFMTELVMDGRIMGENLKRMGVNTSWLEKELSAQGYRSAREVLLAVCDGDKNLTVYGIQ